MDHTSSIVTVEIHGQSYPFRTTLDAAYVAQLAAYVDEKIRLGSQESPAGDTLKIVVLAAINIADECFRARDDARHRQDSMATRAEALERLLDLALGLDARPALAR